MYYLLHPLIKGRQNTLINTNDIQGISTINMHENNTTHPFTSIW